MNDEEISQAAKTIRSSIDKNGLVPLEIFNAITQVAVLSPVDLYAFVNTDSGLKIVVSKRPNNDEFLSGKWHIPGKIMLVTDDSFGDTINRVMGEELPGAKLVSEPRKFRSDLQKTLRGSEHVESYWALIDKLPSGTDGEEIMLANPIDLPTPFLEEQIDRAHESFDLAKDYIQSIN